MINELIWLENKCFKDNWSDKSIREHLEQQGSISFIEYDSEKPVGYALGVIVGEEAELYRIGVIDEMRCKGIGNKILSRFIEKCSPSKKIFLEVRSKNTAAIKIYESAGFKTVYVRKNYYPDDDALNMILYSE